MKTPSTNGPAACRDLRPRRLHRGATAVSSLSLVLAGGLILPVSATAAPVPGAADDEDLLNAFGGTVLVDVLANDAAGFDPGSTVLVAGSERGDTLTVPGEGVWTAAEDGLVTFVPEEWLSADPTPVTYEVTDASGDTSTATITVTYRLEVVDAVGVSDSFDQPVVVPVLDRHAASWDFSTFRLIDPSTGARVTTVTVAGQGTWTLDAGAGTVTFTREAAFYGIPTHVMYEAYDTDGDRTVARVDAAFIGETRNDVSADNVPGTAVTVDVLANDLGSFHPDVVQLLLPGTGATSVQSVIVPGEGTWTVDTAGTITFDPIDGFTGNPTPVLYSAIGFGGADTNASSITISYRTPSAAPVAAGPRAAAPVPTRAAPLPVTG